jgi:hypothetical protein
MAVSSLSSVNTKIDENVLRNIIGHADDLLGFLEKASVDTSTEQQPYKYYVSADLNQRLNQCSEQEIVRDLGFLVKQMDCILALFKRYLGMNISTPAADNTAVPPAEEEHLSLLHAALDYCLEVVKDGEDVAFKRYETAPPNTMRNCGQANRLIVTSAASIPFHDLTRTIYKLWSTSS